MAFISVTWHTVGDDRVCPICKAINGYTWVFDCRTASLLGQLEHPASPTGIVWDIPHGSMAHGHKDIGTCRCNITYTVDISDLVARVEEIRRMLLGIIPEPKGAT